jgi:hypothetical protein
MQTFSSGGEAKEYLIARIVAQADRDGTALSEIERKRMFFTEIGWTLPDMWEVNDVFDAEYDRPAYEAKIGRLARKAKERADEMNELEAWKDAVRLLKREDHYVLVLLSARPKRQTSLLKDRVLLVATALLVCALVIAGMLLFENRH